MSQASQQIGAAEVTAPPAAAGTTTVAPPAPQQATLASPPSLRHLGSWREGSGPEAR